jgi:phosphoglucosamine mutase
VLLNLRVRQRVDLKTIPAVAAVIERVEAQARRPGPAARALLRTEPLLRVMLEGQDQDEIRKWGERSSMR